MKKARYSVSVYGRIAGKDACGGCVNSDKFFKTKRDKERYPIYRSVDLSTPTGKQAVKKYRIERIPHIQKCRIRKDGSKGKCTTVVGWRETDWH